MGSCDLINHAVFTDGMVVGNLDLSQVAMGTTVTLAPLVTTADSLVTMVMILVVVNDYIIRKKS